MKIERLSDNKIKFTLNRADLIEKQIHISELATGSDKAKALFKDLMELAHDELGFVPDERPLMIEAMPLKPDSLVLIITQVNDPEEMNNRFPGMINASTDESLDSDIDSSILDDTPDASASFSFEKKDEPLPGYMVYRFDTLSDIIRVAHVVSDYYDSDNSLYTNPKDKRFYLVMYRNRNTELEYKKTSLKAGEYGTPVRAVYTTQDYFDEHFTLIIRDEALQRLAELR